MIMCLFARLVIAENYGYGHLSTGSLLIGHRHEWYKGHWQERYEIHRQEVQAGTGWALSKVYSLYSKWIHLYFAWILDRQVWCEVDCIILCHKFWLHFPLTTNRHLKRPSTILVGWHGRQLNTCWFHMQVTVRHSAAPRTFSIVLIRRSIIHSVCMAPWRDFSSPLYEVSEGWILREQRRIIHA